MKNMFGGNVWPAFICWMTSVASLCGSELRLTPNAEVRFADEREAAAELRRMDAFTESLSPFDRAARKKTDQPVFREEFLEFVSKQALSWQAEEIERLTPMVRAVGRKTQGLRLNLPATVRLIKTTGEEEGHAAYCRGNCIIFPVARLNSAAPPLERLLIHELFHILSRNDRTLRDALYAIVGFKPCGEIAYPKELGAQKITNPDAPIIEHYITVKAEDKSVSVVPILLSSEKNYDPLKGGEFFAYLTLKLMVIEQHDGQWSPVSHQSKPQLLDVGQVEGFHDQIGQNTKYIIDPEEVLADNFVLLVNGGEKVPTPRIIHEMRRILATASVNRPRP